jgi:aminoglycoside/choline kinase family phosphotransferase
LATVQSQWYLSRQAAASPNAMPAPDAPPVHDVDLAPLDALAARAFPSARATRDTIAWEPMAGGASPRRYFRGRLPSAGGVEAVVGMFVPDGAKPDEIGKAGVTPARWPFLEVRDLLASRGVDVPIVYAEDTARGWVLLEDLGDDTLAAFLVAHPERKEGLYVGAVNALARAQQALASLPEGCVVAGRAFDEDLLHWELQHFREWGLDGRGIALSSEDRAAFDGIAQRLARQIAGGPRVFVHRDYQSRNLMVRRDGGDRGAGTWRSLAWIDFQDALLGPRVYDLVALLNDSYQTFDRAFVETRLDDYARAAGLDAAVRGELVREFDRVTVQRKLKDAGRFVFLDRVKKNPSFLKFVEPTIAKARASLARLTDDEDLSALSGLLARVLGG